MELGLFEAITLSLGAIGFGTWLLVRGGDWTVDSAVVVAERFGVSPLLVGFTVLAFGTSLPELIVSVLANFEDVPGIAIGNVLGSNIANIALVLAVGAMMAPLVVSSKAVKRDLLFMLFATVVFAVVLVGGHLTREVGAGMVVLLLIYIIYQYRKASEGADLDPAMMDKIEKPNNDEVRSALVFLVMGLVAIAFGAEFLVRGARVGAGAVGVPEAVVALSLVAFGTSLPELSTSIIAARKGHSDMMLGNIVGSNVFNILMIMGVATLVKPIPMDSFAPQLASFDIWVTAGVSFVFAAVIFLLKGMGRFLGAAFFLFYVLYNIYIYAIYVTP